MADAMPWHSKVQAIKSAPTFLPILYLLAIDDARINARRSTAGSRNTLVRATSHSRPISLLAEIAKLIRSGRHKTNAG